MIKTLAKVLISVCFCKKKLWFASATHSVCACRCKQNNKSSIQPTVFLDLVYILGNAL